MCECAESLHEENIPRFAMFSGAFVPTKCDSMFAEFLHHAGELTSLDDGDVRKLVKIPSLHICGSSDEIITFDRSVMFAKFFEHPDFVRHEGGHHIPANRSVKEIYLRFLTPFTAKKE
jgi:hypothetical protein